MMGEITEEQLQKVREPIPFTPTKRLERDDVLYVTEDDIPHPIYGYAKSHKEYGVIDLRGYRKGYEPRLEISGIYTPNPEDIFRLQTGKLPPYQPTTTGDRLLAEMRRLGVHKAFRIGKPEEVPVVPEVPAVPEVTPDLDRAAVDLFIERHGIEAYERGKIGETLERIDQKAEEYDPAFLSKHPEIKGESITVYHDPLRGEDLAVINTRTGEVVEVLSAELSGRLAKPPAVRPEEWKLREAVADTAYGLAHGVKEEDLRKHLTRNPRAKYWFEPEDVDYILEEAKREVAGPRLESVIEYDRQYSLEELRRMAKGKGLSPSGSKKEIAARLIAKGVT